MLKKFGLEDSKPSKTPMSTEIKLTKDDEADSVDSSKYQENPKTTHLEAVKRIFRYIRGTSHLGLWYPKGTGIETIVYADSDHAGDYVDRKSTSDNLPPNIKDWELIIRENVICVDTHKSSIDACSAIMLYHLKNSQNFNLAYFIARKIESVNDRVDCPLPYGLFIILLYRFILTKHPKIFRPRHSLQFILHYRMMRSINRKSERKRSKHEEVNIDMPYSPLSVESSNQTSPLLGYWSSVDQF
ncbi:hypothetical protein Tco_1436189 [Tanacetum coccineum]